MHGQTAIRLSIRFTKSISPWQKRKSNNKLLKGQCHEIFDLWFFHQTIPPGLKHFLIWLWIWEVIRQSQCTSGVIDTAGAASVVPMSPLVPPQRCQWHRWCCLSGVNDTAGPTSADSAMQTRFKITLPQWCQWHRCCRLSGVNDTTGAEDLQFERLWLPFKGISIKKIT
jgi:hypothetical protein